VNNRVPEESGNSVDARQSSTVQCSLSCEAATVQFLTRRPQSGFVIVYPSNNTSDDVKSNTKPISPPLAGGLNRTALFLSIGWALANPNGPDAKEEILMKERPLLIE
jgi:hypothetical protein